MKKKSFLLFDKILPTYLTRLAHYCYCLCLACLLNACGGQKDQKSDKEQLNSKQDSLSVDDLSRFRPLYHFSPPKNWTNDPNGMVYAHGEYHLFYQYNPYDNKWGHMTWAHAISKDLVSWEHLPIAIPENEQDSIMIFSGSAVVDEQNTSGFGTKENPPMVAIYTAHYHSQDPKKAKQNQHIAFSTDKGRTWVKYEKNPVIELGKKDFRDPNVFWHEQSKQWVMAVVLPLEHKCLFYGSKNLKGWQKLSEFGEAGDQRKIWECPALIELPTDKGKNKWVLLISSAHPDSTNQYVGMQYFIGNFDGKNFKNDNPPSTTLWLEYGKDFYAAIPWNQTPDKRKIICAWMSNWAYASELPTSPWRGQMSIPRTIALQSYPEGIRLSQQPIKELEKLRKKNHHFENIEINGDSDLLKEIQGNTLEIKVSFEIQDSKEFGLKVAQGLSQSTIIGYEVANQQLYTDRRQSGIVNFKSNFPSKDYAPLLAENGTVSLHIFLDKCSVEVFGNGGKVAMTSLIFPDKESQKLALFALAGKTKIKTLDIWELGE
jgi:sucrose-6-phosphate hydrolase SacC (GH32 family)